MSETVLGSAELFYVYNKTAGDYEPIVCLTSNTLSESVTEVSSVTKCTKGKTIRKAGTYSYETSFEGEYIKPEALKQSWEEIKIYLRSLETFTWKSVVTYADESTSIEYGTGFFSNLEKTSVAGDENITFSGTLMGSGDIVPTDPYAE